MTKSEELRERMSELRAWASSRIRHCRGQEQKFFATRVTQTGIEAAQERRTLHAVLEILGVDEEPCGQEPPP